MTRYYFAGAYARRAELERYAFVLMATLSPSVVTSSWLTAPQEGLDAGFSACQLNTPEEVATAWKYGERDIEDIGRADAIVSFTGEGTRGGRHVEHGVAMVIHDEHPWLGDSREPFRLIVVGPREHVFHCHPDTEVYPDWAAFLEHEKGRA